MIDEFSAKFSGTAFAEYELCSSLLSTCDEPIDLLVNTTSVGLKGEDFGFPVVDCLKPSGAVFDMVYAPELTMLLDQAMKRGLATADGLGMLAAQGEAAFALWFGHTPEPLVMRRALNVSDEI